MTTLYGKRDIDAVLKDIQTWLDTDDKSFGDQVQGA